MSKNDRQASNEPLKVGSGASADGTLFKANNDLKNLMDASEIAIIFVDRDLRVKLFTSRAGDIFNLTDSGLGLPLEHFANRLHDDSIWDDIKQVLHSTKKIKREVTLGDDLSYIMRLTPYQTTEDEVEGVVVTFVEVTELKAAEAGLAEKIEQVKELQRQILKNDVYERWQIGQYLHDDLAQSLTAADMMVSHMRSKLKKEEGDLSKEMDKLKDIIRESVEGARDLSHKIVPVDVQQDGIIKSFAHLSEELEKTYDINCELKGNQLLEGIGDIETAVNLYRIAGEAAKNAAVHGHAENVEITLNADDEFLYLNIEDDGEGFPDSSKADEGIGINIMRHCMELLDGAFKIKKSSDDANNGVMISCKVPVNHSIRLD